MRVQSESKSFEWASSLSLSSDNSDSFKCLGPEEDKRKLNQTDLKASTGQSLTLELVKPLDLSSCPSEKQSKQEIIALEVGP